MLDSIADALQAGDVRMVEAGVRKALATGASPKMVLEEALLRGMDRVGRLFKSGEIYIPDVMMAARAMNAGMLILKPGLIQENVQPLDTVVLGTVQGDHHDIGKNLVKMMLEGSGFAVVDLGVNVSPACFVEAVRTHNARFLGMSALLTTTMRSMRSVVQALTDAGCREQVIVMAGGAPVTAGFAAEIGADLYAPDAASCAEQARVWATRGMKR